MCDEFFYLIDAIGPDKYLTYMETININLLNILGRDYIIDHIIAEAHKQNEQKLLNIYITDALRALVNNIAQRAFEKPSYTQLTVRWLDIIEPQPNNTSDDTRSCKEVVKDIWNNIKKGRG